MKRSQNNTKGKIVSAAWKLFYEQGYDKTTVDDIVEASGTSKGSFYHYFESKESLPASLSYLFDEKYEELTETMDPSLGVIEKLVFINQELFLMIENTVSIDIQAVKNWRESNGLNTKAELAVMKDQTIKELNIHDNVFLAMDLSILDAIENITVKAVVQ